MATKTSGEGAPETRIPLTQLVSFTLPKLAFGLVSAPLFYVLPTFYAQHTSATLAQLGSALVVSRIFDAVADPLVGWLSDKTNTPWGARKPWIVVGALLLALSVFFLFTPTRETGAFHFTLWSLVFYIGWTMFDLPADAWLTELTRDYNDRSRIAGWQGLAGQAGGFIFFAVSAAGLFGQGMSAGVLKAVAWTSLIVLPATVALAIYVVPKGDAQEVADTPRPGVLWHAIRHNGPLRVLLISQLFGGLGGGIFLGTQLLLLDGYFKQGASFAFIFMSFQVVHFAVMPIWLRLVYRFGKHRTWAVSWIMGALMTPATLLIAPGPGALPWLIALAMIRSAVSGADIVVPRAVMADAIDYGVLKTRTNPAGSYFALWSLAVKICAAVSSGLAFWLLAAVGYDPKPGATNTEAATHGLLLIGMGLPAICNLIAASFIWFFPIDMRRARIIQRRIERRRPDMLDASPSPGPVVPALAAPTV